MKSPNIQLTFPKEMSDPYEGLSNEELKEILEDMEADYWIDYYKSNPE